ncbi:Spy/CpxP family protein refolding chaperone [Thiohalomonas denitrificans]|uniref:Protein refolding chaperone Spy/CpxP family n=1 Tax=Thiohalomonas denitrificans TaxID=415747 RepID=A0A1G5PRW3_9GAMM|nr:Spy/CpxP family protein refolding chaperone [Thiohalomonas denitrificans]SCZ51789.1 protein refolding chaperone Spy/CpxP family [Thiohalomonas denitrificans]
MKVKRHWPALIAGTLLVATAGTALAFGPGSCGDHKPMAAVYQLDTLTDSQREQLDALREQRRTAMQKNRQSWQEERSELREAIRSGADAVTIRPLAEKQGQRMADKIVRKAEMRQEIMAILTPEQQQELEKIAPYGEKRGRMQYGM